MMNLFIFYFFLNNIYTRYNKFNLSKKKKPDPKTKIICVSIYKNTHLIPLLSSALHRSNTNDITKNYQIKITISYSMYKLCILYIFVFDQMNYLINIYNTSLEYTYKYILVYVYKDSIYLLIHK